MASVDEISELADILKPDDGEKPNGTKDVESRYCTCTCMSIVHVTCTHVYVVLYMYNCTWHGDIVHLLLLYVCTCIMYIQYITYILFT